MKNKMKTGVLLSAAFIFSLGGGVFANPTKAHRHASASSAAELTWVKTPIGPDASPIRGDMNKGSHATMLKFPSGMKTPVHVHSTDYYGIVISGQMKHAAVGNPSTDKILGPGSHWVMPGNVKHVSECLEGADCVLVLIQDTKFDFIPSEMPAK